MLAVLSSRMGSLGSPVSPSDKLTNVSGKNR